MEGDRSRADVRGKQRFDGMKKDRYLSNADLFSGGALGRGGTRGEFFRKLKKLQAALEILLSQMGKTHILLCGQAVK